jgi:uncharacterized protein (TIGR04222 family)
MNPFDLPGPPFLLFYVLLGACAILAACWRVWTAESGSPPPLPLTEPYQIAWLRGGTPEAARIAVLSLFDRGLIEIDADRLRLGPWHGPPLLSAYPPIERAVLEAAANNQPATAVFADPAVVRACEPFETRLKSLGLVPDAAALRRRLGWYGGAALLLVGVGAVKLLVAYDRGRHNVSFLIALMLAAAVIPALLLRRRRTALGDRILADLRVLFAPQRSRAASLGPGQMLTSDAVLLASAFGLAAFAKSSGYAPLLEVYKKAASSSGGCGSSCGSGCGGGGGGCGGCGSG